MELIMMAPHTSVGEVTLSRNSYSTLDDSPRCPGVFHRFLGILLPRHAPLARRHLHDKVI